MEGGLNRKKSVT